MLNLHQDFKEFLLALNAHNVRYLVVGGYAVAAHGHPRSTKDLDLFIALERANAENTLAAVRDFIGSTMGHTVEDMLNENYGFRLGQPPVCIEVLNEISGVTFEDCWANHAVFEIDGLRLPFIDLHYLRINKAASGRPQDLADLANLPEA